MPARFNVPLIQRYINILGTTASGPRQRQLIHEAESVWFMMTDEDRLLTEKALLAEDNGENELIVPDNDPININKIILNNHVTDN